MKSKFKFEKVSPGWHYDKFAEPTNELEQIDSIIFDDETLKIVDDIIANPYEGGGIKRVHIGNPAEDVVNKTISARVAHMREIGYTENNYFIEFINDKLPLLIDKMSNKYNVSHWHCCVIMIPPSQCMPVHDDTYAYLKKYMKRDYPEVTFDEVKNIRRYMTFLTDWEWGQSFGSGNVIKWQWKKGDVFKWGHKMLHWSSNASLKPIVFFEITGLEL